MPQRPKRASTSTQCHACIDCEHATLGVTSSQIRSAILPTVSLSLSVSTVHFALHPVVDRRSGRPDEWNLATGDAILPSALICLFSYRKTHHNCIVECKNISVDSQNSLQSSNHVCRQVQRTQHIAHSIQQQA
jgi:hypothetical protein